MSLIHPKNSVNCLCQKSQQKTRNPSLLESLSLSPGECSSARAASGSILAVVFLTLGVKAISTLLTTPPSVLPEITNFCLPQTVETLINPGLEEFVILLHDKSISATV